jgi:hypothetical protein
MVQLSSTRHEEVWGSGDIAPHILKVTSLSRYGRSTPEERADGTLGYAARNLTRLLRLSNM